MNLSKYNENVRTFPVIDIPLFYWNICKKWIYAHI